MPVDVRYLAEKTYLNNGSDGHQGKPLHCPSAATTTALVDSVTAEPCPADI